MKKMKNKKIIIFSLLVIGIIVLIEFLLNINNSVKIKDDPELLESYNNNIEQIKLPTEPPSNNFFFIYTPTNLKNIILYFK